MGAEAAGNGAPGEPVGVRLAHATAGRLRLRLASSLARPALEALADRLAEVEGVARVALRPGTGSVILEGPDHGEALLETLVAAGIVRLLPKLRPPPVGRVAEAGLAGLDMELRRRTEGALDFRSSVGLLLLAGALVQLARGQVAGPATTLAVSALAFLEPGRR